MHFLHTFMVLFALAIYFERHLSCAHAALNVSLRQVSMHAAVTDRRCVCKCNPNQKADESEVRLAMEMVVCSLQLGFASD